MNPDNNRQQQLADSGKAAQLAQQKLRQFINLPAQTLDGHSVKLLSNIGQLNQLDQIEQLGIDGIGLLRTELLFMGLKQAPTEEQQYQMYKQTVEAVTPKVVTIRTLDVGADKQLDYIHLDKQENPALGERGVRYSLHNPEQFMVQLRAILRASTLGCIRVMFPMINQVEELIDILDLLAQSKKQLKQQQLDYGKIELGIVVETPAAIINLPSMLPYLDFISIGSNDLSQYTLAVDRTNPVLSQQFSAFSPAIIQSIATVINLAKQQQISVSLCGELASDPRIAPILIGLGLDELSINIGTFLPVKAAICSGQYNHFTQQAAACLKSTKISQLAQYL
ncbi:putative PEP-binding protein [Shewanella marina]|uniref:putative PEP-binding protein n=1 Tax=Shewanella marina TaxID=487319 RepID=UPI000A063030|nr:putative PEP-binding protein [Shewanella marina]